MPAPSISHSFVPAWLGVALACAGLVSCKSEPKPDATPAPTSTASASAKPSASAPAPSVAVESSGVTRVNVAVKVGEELGYAVAATRERVAVSAWKRQGPDDTHPGSVFVFQRKGTQLSQEAELTVDKSHQMGNLVALTRDGLAAGAMFDDGAKKEAGAVYAFTRDEKGWSKGSKLVDKAGKADESFGIGVAAAGETIVASNTRDTGGSLFMFERGKSGWSAKQRLAFSEPGGPAEAVSAFGDIIAVGAQYAGKDEAGTVHLYSRGKRGFAEDTKLSSSSPAENQHFGGSVAVGANLVAVASESHVTIFRKNAGRWSESARIEPPITTALADAGLAIEGGILAIGLPRVDEGRVLVFKEGKAGWKLEKTLTAPDGKKDDWFGYSLALASKLLVIGAPLKDERTGAVYTVVP